MAANEVSINIVAHDMASAALRDVGAALRDVGTSATPAGSSVQGISQDLETGGAKASGMGVAVENLQGKLSSAFSSAGFQSMIMGVGMAAGMMAWNAVQNAMSSAVGFMEDSVKAAEDRQVAEVRLEGALAANIPNWDGNTAAIQRNFAAGEQLGFEQDTQSNALALIVAKTGDVTEALKIESIAMDLARLKGIDLDTATKAIVMGMMGQGRALKELGINVADITNKEEVMTAVEAKAAGQAEGFADTTAGALAVMNVQIHEAQVKIGDELTPAVKELAVAAANFAGPVADGVVSAIRDIGSLAASTASEIDGLTTAWKQFNFAGMAAAPTPSQAPSQGFQLPTIMSLIAANPANQGDIFTSIANVLDPVEAAKYAKAAADAATKAWQTGILSGMTLSEAPIEAVIPIAFKESSAEVLAILHTLTAGVQQQLYDGAAKGSAAFAKGLESGLTDIDASLKDLRTTLKNGLSPTEQIARLGGLLFGADVAKGLNDSSPEAQAAAYATVTGIIAQLDLLKGGAYAAAVNAAFWFKQGWTSTVLPGDTPSEANASNVALKTLAQSAKDVVGAFKPLPSGSTFLPQITSGAAGASTALADAKTKLNALASDAKTNLGTAFDAVKTSADRFFDDLHNKHLQAISDANTLKNGLLDAQINSNDAGVQAARDALQATQDARQLASLQGAVGSATDPAAQAAAQAALSDFQAQQNINAMQKAATQADALLTAQKTANDAQAAEAVKAVTATDAAQKTAFDKELAALQTYLDKHPAMWKSTNAQVIKLLTDSGVTYDAAGANLGKAFAAGLLKEETAVRDAAKALAKAAADVLKIKSPAVLGPLAEDQSVWGENLGKAWAAGLQRGLASYAQLPALADIRLTLQGGGSAPIAPSLGRAVGPAAVGGSGGVSTVNLTVTVAGGIVDPTGTVGQQIANSLILPLRRALDRNGIGLEVR